MQNFWKVLSLLLSCADKSLIIFFVTLLLSLPLGMAVCAGRRSKNPVIAWLIRIYISVMRGTPLMLQLAVVYFCPWYLFHIKLSVFGSNYRLYAALFAFIINYAAYFAEIFRSGLESIPVGQYEAAGVLGYNKRQTFSVIILPQMVRRVLPTVTNEVITLIKDTSLAYTIGVIEMFTKAEQISANMTSIMPLLLAGGIYYVFNFLVATGMEKLEKKLNCYSIK